VHGKTKTDVEFGAKLDISLAKRKCRLGMIVTRLEKTTCHGLAMSVWFQKYISLFGYLRGK